jgi:hypothetical protein
MAAPVPSAVSCARMIHPSGVTAITNASYRTLALRRADEFLWFWIGDHKSYEDVI